ncbi:MAG: DNA-processing protein DprA, partial [Stackebrandtia sp.]
IDRPWPLGGGGVCAVVAQTGVVVSAEPPGAAATLTRARQSLRLLASASAALVVVETVAGSQLTRAARVAAGTGRLVCAVPGPVTSAASSGCHQLLRDGAARAATCADDVLDDLATTTSRRACPDEAHAEADPSAPAEVRRS